MLNRSVVHARCRHAALGEPGLRDRRVESDDGRSPQRSGVAVLGVQQRRSRVAPESHEALAERLVERSQGAGTDGWGEPTERDDFGIEGVDEPGNPTGQPASHDRNGGGGGVVVGAGGGEHAAGEATRVGGPRTPEVSGERPTVNLEIPTPRGRRTGSADAGHRRASGRTPRPLRARRRPAGRR